MCHAIRVKCTVSAVSVRFNVIKIYKIIKSAKFVFGLYLSRVYGGMRGPR
jgi:hypothetical protein